MRTYGLLPSSTNVYISAAVHIKMKPTEKVDNNLGISPQDAANAPSESTSFDFKASFDPAAASIWCELVKDIAAIANSGGGAIVFGVNDDGTPAKSDLTEVLGIYPATIVDKFKKYTGQHYAGCSIAPSTRGGHPVAVMSISAVSI